MGDHRRRRVSGEDRISGLPDALLHEILVRLRSADAAARTSVLSRRWRHVWAHLPELRLVAPREAAPASFIDHVDAALGGYLAPSLEHLGVFHCTGPPGRDLHFAAGRIASWLHFAAERVVGELNLYLHVPRTLEAAEDVAVLEFPACERAKLLEFPACERAKRIELFLQYAYTMWLRPQASGLFTVLTYLKISGYVQMEGRDLTALVSTQCPCLTDLILFIKLIVNFDVNIHSNSLHTIVLRVLETRRLEILAPRLEELTIFIKPMEAHISTPKLVKVTWQDAYDPHLHRFVDVGRTLQLLKTSYEALSLTKQFDEVIELDMDIDIYFPDGATYGRFLDKTNKLPKCKSFSVYLSWEYHALVPIVLQLLRSCSGTKKFQIKLLCGRVMHSCLLYCHCRLEKSHQISGIDFSSLEEVEITGFSGSREEMELVELVFSNAGILKRLVINDKFCDRPKEAHEKVRSMCHPNVRIEFRLRD